MTVDHLSELLANPLTIVTGVDEAGRGPLAGPVVAAAVILDPKRPIDGLADSKTLSEKKRLTLNATIQERALAWSIASADVREIDTLNILRATLLAMQRAVAELAMPPDLALIDGNQLPALPIPARAIVQGDRLIPEISAASILAKVYRDRLMLEYAERFPDFAFDRHKGYGTQDHLAELARFGPTPVHRRSFKPVRDLLPSGG